MMIKYLAFDIGCMECGETSKVIGVYNTEKEAEQAITLEEELQSENWRGQHDFEVYKIEV